MELFHPNYTRFRHIRLCGRETICLSSGAGGIWARQFCSKDIVLHQFTPKCWADDANLE